MIGASTLMLTLALACSRMAEMSPTSGGAYDEAPAPMEIAQEKEAGFARGPSAASPATVAVDGLAALGGARAEGRADKGIAMMDDAEGKDQQGEGEPADGEGGGRTRSWFPEAFLWQPQVETGDDGVATLDVRVPDALTTWRVLALAHAGREQAGTVHEFQGTLPLYVDPVVPGWLYAGDRLMMPVQAVNTTAQPVTASVSVTAEGALTGSGQATMALGPAGSDVRSLPLDATGAGIAKITAVLAGEAADKVERTIPVSPTGRPVERTRVGTLASARAFTLPPPEGADPTTDRIEVTVFPGPLAVVQLELERLQGGARPVDPAYAFALTSRVASLSEGAGVPVDDAVLRRMRILGWQRIASLVMAPDPGQAADLLASVRDESVFTQVADLRGRLARVVVDGQRADGTWSRNARSTLQQVLVETAFAARSLPADERGARVRASGAIERHVHDIDDAYTAAVVLAADLAPESLRDDLLKKVAAAVVVDAETGERDVDVPDAVTNPWGQRPSRAELLAWVVLALPITSSDRGDLAAALMQSWTATGGFGAGPADAIALEAVSTALGGVSSPVTVSLDVDGVASGSAKLDPHQPRVPALLGAPAGGADATFTVTASPAVPGLTFVATRRSWVPWTERDRLSGVDIAVATRDLAAGREGELSIEASAPSGIALRIEQGLPAGTVLGDSAPAAAAQIGATLDVRTDRVILTTRPFQAGERMAVSLPVIPAFAGRFQTGPLLVSPGDGRKATAHRPVVWVVAGP